MNEATMAGLGKPERIALLREEREKIGVEIRRLRGMAHDISAIIRDLEGPVPKKKPRRPADGSVTMTAEAAVIGAKGQ